MKKFLTIILSLFAIISAAAFFTACENQTDETPPPISGGEYPDGHEHTFVKEGIGILKTPATCQKKAVYYSFCSECGKIGSETYEYGEVSDHEFDVEIVNDDYLKTPATCTQKAEYFRLCKWCGKVSDKYTFFAGDFSEEHPSGTVWYSNDKVHYHKSTCEHGVSLESAPHSYGENNKCVVCGIDKPSVGLQYEYQEGLGYFVGGIGTCTDKNIVIMPEYNGEPVVEIGLGAFSGADIECVTVPDSIIRVARNAFYGCDNLSKIYYKGDLNGWINVNQKENLMSFGASEKELYLNGELLSDAVITNLSIDSYAFYNVSNLKTVAVSNAAIGDYAFAGCKNLTEVTVSGGKGFMGRGVFKNCTSLKNVSFGDNVTAIPHDAFANCTALQQIVIPNGVTIIGSYAFSGCSALSDVTVPGGVTSIEGCAFIDCNALEKIRFGGTTNDWVQIENLRALTEFGVVENKQLYINGELLTDAVITDAKSICDYAFYNFNHILSITIPASVKSVGAGAFTRCNSLDKIYYGGNVNDWVQVDGVNRLTDNKGWHYKKLFINDKPLTEAVLDKATHINDYAFYGCATLETVTIGDSVETVGSEVFYGCSSLKTVYVGGNASGFSAFDFLSCPMLESITVSESNENYFSVDGILYDKKANEFVCVPANIGGDITVPECITEIGYSAFKNRVNVTSVTIESDAPVTIGESAFYGCTSLKTIAFGGKISIGEYAFVDCKALENIYYRGDVNDWVTISGLYNLMWRASSFKKLYINGELLIEAVIDKAEYINSYAFQKCYTLECVTIGSSVKNIGSDAFGGCLRLAEVINESSLNIEKGSSNNGYAAYYALSVKNGGTSDIVKENGFSFITVDGLNYLLSYSGNETELTLPEGFNGEGYAIYNFAFAYNDSLESLVIPNGVTSIGDYAFDNCVSLKSITIPASVKSIGAIVFRLCTSLRQVSFGGTMAEWEVVAEKCDWESYIKTVHCLDGDVTAE